MAFVYNTGSKRYHDTSTGQFVGRVEVRKALDDVIDISAERMRGWTQQLRDNELDLPDWQLTMGGEIKALHMSFAAAANGGWDNMDDEDWDRVEGYIADQFDYLEGFAEDLFTGAQPLNGAMEVRATLYAESARQTYENERRILEVNAGATEEMNILGGSDHCVDCVDATGAGWVPINTLIPIGLRACQAKCHCTIIYRTGPNDELGSQIEQF